MTRLLLATVACLAATVPAQAQSTGSDADVREIRRLREASNAAIARHDTAGIGAAFAEHVIVVTSRSAQSIGRQANLTAFAEQFAALPDVFYRRSPGEVRLFPQWAMASESGEWTGGWTDPDGKLTIGGRYFAKWRKLAGRWLIESETYVPERCAGSAYCARVP